MTADDAETRLATREVTMDLPDELLADVLCLVRRCRNDQFKYTGNEVRYNQFDGCG